MLDYIIARLREPSTYAGFTGLALAVGLTVTEWEAIAAALAAIAGLLAVVLPSPEKGDA